MKPTSMSPWTWSSIRLESAMSLSMTSHTCSALSPNLSLSSSIVRICAM
jgi:hypothetical protein